MLDHIARALYDLEVHLLYASLVWLSAWALTSIPHFSATAKYWIWVASSVNFIVPVGPLLDALWAPRLPWAAPLGFVNEIGANITSNAALPVMLCVAWLLGSILMWTRLISRIQPDHRDMEVDQKAPNAQRSFFAQGVRVDFASSDQAPAVTGILRPQILLPSGIDRLLSRHELDAVLIHELTHARRRDNLIRLIHEVGLCVLWFHPMLWISGSRLALYRELSCDESVIRRDRGKDLVSALAKLVSLRHSSLLQARASSHLSYRLSLLAATPPRQARYAASTLLIVLFSALLLGGIVETVAHTAFCLVAKP